MSKRLAISKECREIDLHLDRLAHHEDAMGDPAWEEHVEHCADCRSQWAVEVDLRQAFAGVPRPALSSSFQHDLERRLARETAHSSTRALRRVLLPAYWLAACVTIFYILTGLADSNAATWCLWAALAMVGLAFGPLAVLARRWELDVFDLIFVPAE